MNKMWTSNKSPKSEQEHDYPLLHQTRWKEGLENFCKQQRTVNNEFILLLLPPLHSSHADLFLHTHSYPEGLSIYFSHEIIASICMYDKMKARFILCAREWSSVELFYLFIHSFPTLSPSIIFSHTFLPFLHSTDCSLNTQKNLSSVGNLLFKIMLSRTFELSFKKSTIILILREIILVENFSKIPIFNFLFYPSHFVSAREPSRVFPSIEHR